MGNKISNQTILENMTSHNGEVCNIISATPSNSSFTDQRIKMGMMNGASSSSSESGNYESESDEKRDRLNAEDKQRDAEEERQADAMLLRIAEQIRSNRTWTGLYAAVCLYMSLYLCFYILFCGCNNYVHVHMFICHNR